MQGEKGSALELKTENSQDGLSESMLFMESIDYASFLQSEF